MEASCEEVQTSMYLCHDVIYIYIHMYQCIGSVLLPATVSKQVSLTALE